MYSKVVRRPLWVRFFIACWSLWLVAALSEPAALSACPAHSSHAAHSATMHGGDAMQAHSTHSTAHHLAQDGASQSGPTDQHSSQHCSCLGECCCTPSVAPPAATVAELPAVAVTHVTPAATCDSAPASLAPYSLPFANGPPGDLVA